MASATVSSLFVMVTILISGCTCSNDLVTPREADPTTRSRLRIAVASPDVTTLIVEQNDRELDPMLRPDAQSSSYRELPSGIRNIRLRTQIHRKVVFSANLDFSPNQGYTLVVLDQAERMRGLLFEDFPQVPEPGTARVRIINAVQDAVCGVVVQGTTIVEGIRSGEASQYVSVRADVPVAVTLTGRPGLPTISLPSTVSEEFASHTVVIRERGSSQSIVLLAD